jgi:microcystin-dependent protein
MTESEMACTVVRSIVDIGDMGGAENATIGVNQMPAHTHVITASP